MVAHRQFRPFLTKQKKVRTRAGTNAHPMAAAWHFRICAQLLEAVGGSDTMNPPPAEHFLAALHRVCGSRHCSVSSDARENRAEIANAIRESTFVVPADPDWRAERSMSHLVWTDFSRILRFRMNNRAPPLTPYERNTVSHFDLIMDVVLTILSEKENQRLTFGIPEVIRHFQGGDRPIDISGVSGYVIRSNDDVYCIVEHKHHEVADDLFNEGVDQALIYAAALHTQHPERPVLAIVTDLDRWVFLEVNYLGCTRSSVFRIRYNQDGTPIDFDLKVMIERVLGFLYSDAVTATRKIDHTKSIFIVTAQTLMIEYSIRKTTAAVCRRMAETVRALKNHTNNILMHLLSNSFARDSTVETVSTAHELVSASSTHSLVDRRAVNKMSSSSSS